jgi:hypothetical protein
VAALVVNDGKWKIKGSYVGKEAFSAFFGYPSSDPPVYAKARGKKKSFRQSSRKKGGARSSSLAGREGGTTGKKAVSAPSKGTKKGAAKAGGKKPSRRGAPTQAKKEAPSPAG